jgi:hypothetical protein
VARASRAAAQDGRPLGDVLLGTPEFAGQIAATGIRPAQVEQALVPAAYLGAASAFVSAALAAHERRKTDA